MALTLRHITFDCIDAAALAGFWSQMLDLPVDPDANRYFATVGRTTWAAPLLMFIQVPEKTPGKNTVHLDLVSTDYAAELDRAVSLGARRIGDFDEYGTVWTTLADPEGNLFDVARG